jgi:RHS repeat-associated protein
MFFSAASNPMNQTTSKERDAETGLDYFGARYYSGPQGRFTSPDWSSRAQAIPYANIYNPQSLNLYNYARNNPINRIDINEHADINAICKGKQACSVTTTQTVNLYRWDKKAKSYQVYSALKLTTTFSVTTNAKGVSSVSATAKAENVSGDSLSKSKLDLMGTNLGAIQAAGVQRGGYGQYTTELLTAIAGKEGLFGAASNPPGSADFKDPAINPLQLSGGRANLDRQHNIAGALDVLDWAFRATDTLEFNPRPIYEKYSGQPSTTVDGFMQIYNNISEDVTTE